MSARRTNSALLVTERALRDIAEIEEYSVAEWGRRVAAKYIEELEEALGLLRERPDLLRMDAEVVPGLHFYRVKKHLLVCTFEAKAIVLLTVIHSSRDIPSRLAEMQPSLAAEVELLQQKLNQK